MSYVDIANGETGLSARNKINGLGLSVDTHSGLNGTNVHGLGTLSTQNANAVSITAGTISGTLVTVTSASAALTLGTIHNVVLVTGSPIISLPTCVGISGRIYNIKNVGTGTITITATGSQVIDDTSSKTISSRYSSLQIVSDGSNWNII